MYQASQPLQSLSTRVRTQVALLRDMALWRMPHKLQSVEASCDFDCHSGQGGLGENETPHETIWVIFAWESRARNVGSVLLRSKQLAELLNAAAENIVASSESIQALARRDPLPNAIILSDSCLRYKGLSQLLLRARKAGTVVIFDSVDKKPERADLIDSFVTHYFCASHGEFQYRLARGQKATFLAHHVDLRLPRNPSRPPEQFSLGYAGHPMNALYLRDLGIDVWDASSNPGEKRLAKFAGFLSSHSHHYSVRNVLKRDGFKPGLKIYIASHFGATFIGSQSDQEAIFLLGDDYPYLSNDSSFAEVERTIAFARETFDLDARVKAKQKLMSLRREFCRLEVAKVLLQTLIKVLK